MSELQEATPELIQRLIREVRLRRVFQARIDAASSDTPLGDWHMRSKPHLVLHVRHTCPDDHPNAYRYRWWAMEFPSGARTGNYRTVRRVLDIARNRLAKFGSAA